MLDAEEEMNEQVIDGLVGTTLMAAPWIAMTFKAPPLWYLMFMGGLSASIIIIAQLNQLKRGAPSA